MPTVFNSPYLLVALRKHSLLSIVSIALVNVDVLPVISLSSFPSSLLCLLFSFLIMIYFLSDKSHCSDTWQIKDQARIAASCSYESINNQSQSTEHLLYAQGCL